MFRKFDMFRILICGGDGSVGWVLTEMDKLNLSSKVTFFLNIVLIGYIE